MGPEPMTFEMFLGSVVWFFKTYFMVMLGILGIVVLMSIILGILMWRRYRRNGREILSGRTVSGAFGRFPKL